MLGGAAYLRHLLANKVDSPTPSDKNGLPLASVAIPLLGSGVFLGGAYGSHLADNLGASIGIPKKLRLNPEAISAIEAYANLRPDKINPETFAAQYADAAHRAGSSKLFKNSPHKTWYFEMNNNKLREGVSRALTRASEEAVDKGESLRRLGLRLPKWLRASKVVNKISDKLVNLPRKFEGMSMFAPITSLAKLNGLNLSKAGDRAVFAKLLAHTPEMATSPVNSYVRLLHEIAGGLGRSSISDQVLVDNTVEALVNYNNPTFGEYAGKKFKSPAEYFGAMMGTNKKYPHLYKKYLDSFKDAYSKNPTNNMGGLGQEVKRMLVPHVLRDAERPLHRGMLHGELSRVIGDPGTWKLTGDNKQLVRVSGSKLAPGVRSIQDIVDKSLSHPGLLFLNAQAAKSYGDIGKSYGKTFKLLKTLQRVRDPRLRLAFGGATAGLAGLAGFNLFKGRKDK